MLRPATPLTVILFIAFALLLISVISTPLIKGIKIASDGGVDFGVFGYCKGDECSGIKIGYSTNPNGLKDGDFSLPASARHALSPLLIVHPIAALFTLILLILSLTAHLHSPSHSPRYLLALLVLTVPAILLSLLAFLVDILIFIPHLSFGGWLVLGATILLAASSVITCAMRRTLVSRKARKKRIAENDEMNGNNFYKTQSATSAPPTHASTAAPLVNGAPGADKLPEFATFDTSQKSKSDVSNDDRVPLNSRSNSHKAGSDEGSDRYGAPPRLGQNLQGRGRGGADAGARDQYGNPLAPSDAFGAPPPDMRRDPSEPRNRGPLPLGGRGGRGGYPPRGGRGGYAGGWRGPAPQGYGGDGRNMGPMMAGAGAGLMAGGARGRAGPRGPAPPGYNGYGAPPPGQGRGYPREASPYGGGYAAGGGLPPHPAYAMRQSSPGPPIDPAGYNGYGAGPEAPQVPPLAVGGAMQRQMSPPLPLPLPTTADGEIVGQAIEMDASTGSPSPSHAASPNLVGSGFGPDRHSPGNGEARKHLHPMRQPSGALSPTSVYSAAPEYVPPRAAWAEASRTGSPLNTVQEPSNLGPIKVELPSAYPAGKSPAKTAPNHARVNSGDNYYEDVDPRFVEVEPLQTTSELPASLTPGYGVAAQSADQAQRTQPHDHLHPNDGINRDNSYEDLHSHSRSPAESDTSHYTSVSQRGVNPNWRPGPDQQDMGMVPSRGPRHAPPQHHQRDMLFQGNSEFELPGGSARPGAGSRGAGRLPGAPPPPATTNGAGGGRYPAPNEI